MPCTIFHLPTDGPLVVGYYKALCNLQEYFTLSDNMSANVIVELGGTLKMFVSPNFKKTNDVLNYVLMNSINTKFAPVMVGKEMVDYFLMINLCHEIPNFVLKGAMLTVDQLAGTGITNPHMFMIASPKTMPLCSFR